MKKLRVFLKGAFVETWQEDQLTKLCSIHCEHKLFVALAEIARDLGFDHCAYGLRTPLPISRPKTVMFNNYPTAWQVRYQERNYLDIDPTVRHGIRSLQPVIWSNDLSVPVREFWEEVYSFGLRFGWAQSSRDATGTIGMLTLARSGEPLSDSELRDKGFKMAWLVQIAHLGMSTLLTPKMMRESTVQLTEREIMVLRWTAEGKTSGEISSILDITERTVNFHIVNAMVKLNAVNKTAAAIRAAMVGLLCIEPRGSETKMTNFEIT